MEAVKKHILRWAETSKNNELKTLTESLQFGSKVTQFTIRHF